MRKKEIGKEARIMKKKGFIQCFVSGRKARFKLYMCLGI